MIDKFTFVVSLWLKSGLVILGQVGLLLCSFSVLATHLQVVTENWPPYNYSEDGQIKGSATEIVKKVLNHAGIEHQISLYPWARAYKMAQEQQNVLIYSMVRIPSREKRFRWIRPLGQGGVIHLYRLAHKVDINFSSIAEAKAYQIITNLDTVEHHWLTNNGFSRLLVPTNVEQAIKMFYKGRADLIALDSATMAAEVGRLGLDINQLVRLMPLFKTPPYMALSLNSSKPLADKLRRSYDQLFQQGKIKLVN